MVLQLIVLGIVLGCNYALLAVSWGIIFKVTKTFHFAHGAIYTMGAYFAFLLFDGLGMPLAFSFAVGVIGASLAGAAVEVLFYKPLRRVNATPMSILIASLGLLIIIEMLIVIFVGDGPQSIGYQPKLITVGNISFTRLNVYLVGIGVTLVAAVLWFLSKTRIGRTMEAVANNPELAELFGINADRIFTYAFLIGSGLAGVSAILTLMDRGVTPFGGTMAATIAFIAVIIGGVKSILGGAIAGLILGMAINLCVIGLPSEWQYPLVFILVVLLLIIRPEGLLEQQKS